MSLLCVIEAGSKTTCMCGSLSWLSELSVQLSFRLAYQPSCVLLPLVCYADAAAQTQEGQMMCSLNCYSFAVLRP